MTNTHENDLQEMKRMMDRITELQSENAELRSKLDEYEKIDIRYIMTQASAANHMSLTIERQNATIERQAQALAEVVEYCTAVTAPVSGMIEPQPPVWAQMLMRVNEIAKEGLQ